MMVRSALAPRGGRTRSACDLCRHKKIRCDGVKPACETCRCAGVFCTFTTPEPQPHKSVREQLSDSKARVRQLEEALVAQGYHLPDLQAFYSPAPPLLRNTSEFDAAIEAFQWHIAFCGPGVANTAERQSFYSNIYQHTGSVFNIDDFCHQVTRSFKWRYPNQPKTGSKPKWPTIYLVQQCIEYYSRNGLYSIFPIVDTEALQSLLNAGTLNQSQQTGRASNRACLVAFTAMISRIHRHDPVFAGTDSDGYMQAVLTLLPNLLMEDPDIRTLESILILALYLAPMGQPQSAELLLAVAIRVLLNLGGQRPIELIEGTPRDREHLRNLFWACYGPDKEMSIRKRQQPMLQDEDCDLELPAKYVLQSSDHQFLQKKLSADRLLYPSDLRLAMLKSKIHRFLYSDHARVQSDARRLQYIRELDQELSDLKASFPPRFQPDAYFATETTPDYSFHDLSMRGVGMHLDYYFCLGKIHEASSKSSMPSPTSWSLLPSSMELYYQAARSTLFYMNRVCHFVNPDTFWIHAQFTMTSVLCIFWYLITRPTAETVMQDLQLLEDTKEVFSTLNRNTGMGDGNTFPPFYIAEAFVERLINLGKQTILTSVSM